MVDTTTINFALDKMSQAWQKAAPTLSNLSEEYIRFCVAKAVIPVPILLFVGIVGVIFFVKWIKYEKRDDIMWNPDIVGITYAAVGWLGTIMGWIGFFCHILNAALALYCPRMFTIHQIIGAAK